MLQNLLLFSIGLLSNTHALPAFGVSSGSLNSSFDGRIVGGSGVLEGQFPSMVSLQTPAQRHFCGGSIISSRWLLTAAHCVFDRQLSDILVRSGTIRHNNGGIFNIVIQIRVHDQFVNEVNRYNDIAALQIAGQFGMSQMTRPITLDTSASLGLTGAVVLGWGRTAVRPNILNVVKYIQL